ncbi:MAG: minichromosome maintenance protein MCM [Candidatus Aenigmarchaeota archaeon]|nr:minichromosome maintenance protein MCM [Candidatus Aenigmarchaeota archaeon]
MDYSDVLKKFEIFLTDVCYNQLLKAVQESTALVIDYEALERFDPELFDYFLEHPEECMQAVDEAMSNIDIGEEVEKKIPLRIRNLPDTEMIMIKNLRSTHLSRFIGVEGLIKQASEVRPEITFATWECQSCGEKIAMLQEEQTLEKPYMCECGNKRGFHLVSRKMVDVQRIVTEESPESLDGGQQARKLGIYLKNDLVDPTFQKKVVPGNKVLVTGVLNDMPIRVERGKETKRRDIFIDCNYLEPIEKEFEDIEITEDDEKQIKKIAKDKKIFDMLKKSIAPSIFGYDDIKLAIAFQLFSGVQKVRPDGMKTRGDIHILLIGDPGAAKSQMLKYVSSLAPKGRYVVGKSSSGAGLTAAAVKDEFTGTWALEAGALVLANGGMCAIDEMDKMDATDRSSMHEVMEQQTVTVSKASIQATLSARTIILAAANPKYGRFDPYTPIPDQINLPDTLISRFDLIFAIRDVPSREKDTSLAEHILRLHENPEEENVPLSAEMLRKYIAYARINCAPKLTKGAMEVIKEFYVNIRNQNPEDEKSPVPLTARQLEALVRLAEASAKIRLAETVTKADANRGIELLTNCLKQVGIDPETGQFDIDRLSSGVTSSKRNKIMDILRIIKEMQDESSDKLVNYEDLMSRTEEEGMDSLKVKEIVESLKKDGELFEPRPGFLKKV